VEASIASTASMASGAWAPLEAAASSFVGIEAAPWEGASVFDPRHVWREHHCIVRIVGPGRSQAQAKGVVVGSSELSG